MNPRLTRNELLRRGAAGGALLAFPSILAACGGGGGGGSTDGGELKDVLNFANWPLYIDTDKPTTLDDFTKQTGIKVNYFEEINDNDEYFAKVQGPLSQGQGIDRDIFVFTDNSRFPGILVNEGWVQKLDKELIPNFVNLVDAQSSPPFDPNREYSLPYQSGMTGIAWNGTSRAPSSRSSSFSTTRSSRARCRCCRSWPTPSASSCFRTATTREQ
jgi:spermidine/putrescine transport system substrate-binding protein